MNDKPNNDIINLKLEIDHLREYLLGEVCKKCEEIQKRLNEYEKILDDYSRKDFQD